MLYNSRIPHHVVTKKKTLNKLLHNNGLIKNRDFFLVWTKHPLSGENVVCLYFGKY